MTKQGVLLEEKELTLKPFFYQWTWQINKSKVKQVIVKTEGKNSERAKIELVKRLGVKTHSNTDESLLKLFDTLEKIYDIRLVNSTLV